MFFFYYKLKNKYKKNKYLNYNVAAVLEPDFQTVSQIVQR